MGGKPRARPEPADDDRAFALASIKGSIAAELKSWRTGETRWQGWSRSLARTAAHLKAAEHELESADPLVRDSIRTAVREARKQAEDQADRLRLTTSRKGSATLTMCYRALAEEFGYWWPDIADIVREVSPEYCAKEGYVEGADWRPRGRENLAHTIRMMVQR